ncbi:MAG: hypothetical protein EZS28_042007 [Streblomastix strix]|uniref:Uncharacterized protein n=1 Tax=Streblomastix strix TaxID=222440 RepID=A0A5J4TVG6_9EUKA|nr:MAG: hypothetical protein EZS28_042007 [Streblomastix strix]
MLQWISTIWGTLPLRVQLQTEQSQTIHPSTNTSFKQSITENEIRQCTGNNNSTDLAGTIVVHKTKEFIHQIPFPWIIRQNSGNGIENEGQGSKTSTTQCWLLPSGPVADVGRDLLMIYVNMRGFFQEGVNLLFKGQRFNTVKRDFYYLALLQDWLDIERITIDEMMKKDAEVILTEVIAFHTRQNNSVASAKSHKACLTTMSSLIYKENLASPTTSNQLIRHQLMQQYYIEAELRLKFSNVNRTENQASVRLAPKQENAIEIYEIYETDNEKLSPKLAIYEWIYRLKKQFPKGTDFLLWNKGNVLISALSFHALQPTISIIRLVRSFSSLGNSLLISISPRVGIHILGGPEVRQGDTGITNHYPVSYGDEDNNWLHPSLLISPHY